MAVKITIGTPLCPWRPASEVPHVSQGNMWVMMLVNANTGYSAEGLRPVISYGKQVGDFEGPMLWQEVDPEDPSDVLAWHLPDVPIDVLRMDDALEWAAAEASEDDPVAWYEDFVSYWKQAKSVKSIAPDLTAKADSVLVDLMKQGGVLSKANVDKFKHAMSSAYDHAAEEIAKDVEEAIIYGGMPGAGMVSVHADVPLKFGSFSAGGPAIVQEVSLHAPLKTGKAEFESVFGKGLVAQWDKALAEKEYTIQKCTPPLPSAGTEPENIEVPTEVFKLKIGPLPMMKVGYQYVPVLHVYKALKKWQGSPWGLMITVETEKDANGNYQWVQAPHKNLKEDYELHQKMYAVLPELVLDGAPGLLLTPVEKTVCRRLGMRMGWPSGTLFVVDKIEKYANYLPNAPGPYWVKGTAHMGTETMIIDQIEVLP